MMTREQAIRKRDKVAAQLCSASEILRGSLLQRTVRHSSGCLKCARGEGHPLWVLNVGYPGGKTRQVSLRPSQVPQVRKAIEHYRGAIYLEPTHQEALTHLAILLEQLGDRRTAGRLLERAKRSGSASAGP